MTGLSPAVEDEQDSLKWHDLFVPGFGHGFF